MSPDMLIILSMTSYKIVSLLVGLILCYLGYKLFMAGVWGPSGDLDAKFRNYSIVLRSAAPGTFFVLLGTIVIAVTIWKGIELGTEHRIQPHATTKMHSSESSLPDKPPFSE